MEKFIRIDGREVPFRATAAVPRLYRIKFGRDIMQDMRDLQAAIEKSESGEQPIPVKLLEVFENAAYLMARHADPDMKEHSVEEWLDTFGTFSIYELNNLSIGESKKKTNPVDREMTTALFLLRAAQLGIPIRDLELLTIGMVTDMLIEAGNDDCEYDRLPTQADFDGF